MVAHRRYLVGGRACHSGLRQSVWWQLPHPDQQERSRKEGSSKRQPAVAVFTSEGEKLKGSWKLEVSRTHHASRSPPLPPYGLSSSGTATGKAVGGKVVGTGLSSFPRGPAESIHRRESTEM